MSQKLVIEAEVDVDPDGLGEFAVIELPAKYEVCGRCEGRGSHTNPNIDSHGITREEFDEDPDFEEAYFRGDYDVSCYECKGARVVLVVDEDAAKLKDPAVLKQYKEQLERKARWDREDAYTRRMESGGHDY